MSGGEEIWAIVPVKRFSRAKSRLAGALDQADRFDLSLQMLDRVVGALRESRLVRRWLVVSRDSLALSIAERRGGLALREKGQGLNSSLRQAARWATEQGASALLVLPSDLPLATGADIDAVISVARASAGVVIVPSRRGDGTNALFLRPPAILPFSFGPASAVRHAAMARERGLDPCRHVSEALGFDVDTEEDLRDLLSLRAGIDLRREKDPTHKEMV